MNEPPFSLPDDVDDDLDHGDQRLDSNIDEHELYDEGKEGAAEVDIPDRPGRQDAPLSEDDGERIA